MATDLGRSLRDGLSPFGSSQQAVSPVPASIPSAVDGTWFCDRGNFWGTVRQLLLCAKCGEAEFKRYDEPRHYVGILTPHAHTLCDQCFDTLPSECAAIAIEARSGETGTGSTEGESAGRDSDIAQPKSGPSHD